MVGLTYVGRNVGIPIHGLVRLGGVPFNSKPRTFQATQNAVTTFGLEGE
jgi:hypothetical protein